MFQINRKLTFDVIPNKQAFFIHWKTKTTLYDALQLKKDCSSKEIKDSYIRLSKLYHPDKIKNTKECHQKFLKINEAYQTLSKPLSRRNYDLELECPTIPVNSKQHYQNYDITEVYKDTIFQRSKGKPRKEDEYYGVKGIKKQNHFVIVLLCVSIAIIGFAIQMILVKMSMTFKRDKMQKASEATELILAELRKTSELNSRELQIEIMKKRFEEAELERKKR